MTIETARRASLEFVCIFGHDAHMVRRCDDGYRIPTPAEDDWERQRASLSPKPGNISRLHAEIVTALWQPQPQHGFLDVKVFKVGLYLDGQLSANGDIPVHLTLAEAGSEHEGTVKLRHSGPIRPQDIGNAVRSSPII